MPIIERLLNVAANYYVAITTIIAIIYVDGILDYVNIILVTPSLYLYWLLCNIPRPSYHIRHQLSLINSQNCFPLISIKLEHPPNLPPFPTMRR
jgi:hypothetical protein